jgi:hypothetical protein
MEESASPEGSGTTSDWRASLTAVGGVLGAVALMLLLVTWAATIGPEEVVRGKGNPPTNMSVPPKPTVTVPANPGHDRPQGGGDSDVLFTLMTLVAVTLATVVMLAVLLSVVRWLMAREWKLRRREPEPEELEFDPLEAPALLARAMVVDASAQRELLASGSPRNAIVACWHRFEEQAALAGVQRGSWETSSEFTLRVLDGLSADSESVLQLADLYRAARHSTHEITEDDRARAQAALDVVHRSLGHTARSHSRPRA